MRLRKHTQILRRTVTQQGRVILVPELVEDKAVGPDAVRTVQVLVAGDIGIAAGPNRYAFPADGDLQAYVDRIRRDGGLVGVDDVGALPEDIVESRAYQWPTWPPGSSGSSFSLRADQWLAAISLEPNVVDITLIVEYVE